MVWNLNTPRTHPSNCRHLAKIQEYSCEEGAFNLAASQGQSVAWVADPRKGDLHFCEILPRSQRDLPHGGQPLPSPWGIVTMWLSTAIDCPHSKEAGGQLPPLISHCKQNLISGLSVSYSSGEKRKKKTKKTSSTLLLNLPPDFFPLLCYQHWEEFSVLVPPLPHFPFIQLEHSGICLLPPTLPLVHQ